MKILLIDDERRKAQPLVQYLEVVCGWTVELAPGPRRALEVIHERNDFQVVVLDIMMDPEGVVDLAASDRGRGTGLLLLERISECIPGVPIIIYTARIDLSSLAEDSRVAALVQKPSTARALVETIRGIVEG